MIAQGTAEWRQARLGRVTASRIADVTAKLKSGGWGAMRANYMAELLVERLTGVPHEGFTSPAMQWGTDTEPMARAAYEFMTDSPVAEVGFVPHPVIAMAGASPDGFVGDDGLVEIKCPNTATHVDTLLGAAIPANYVAQMQWQMACTSRLWCDWVSFDPRLPASMQLHVRRVERDPAMIVDLERTVIGFLAELDQKATDLQSRYGQKEAA